MRKIPKSLNYGLRAVAEQSAYEICDNFTSVGMAEYPEFGDVYRLNWQTPGTELVAEIRNYALDQSGYRRVPVLLDDSRMEKIKMRLLASYWDDKGPAIFVSTAFMKIPRDLREAGIWHEMGHIHHEHHFCAEYFDQSELRLARISTIEKGAVLKMEEEADRFAVLQSSKRTLIEFLEYTLNSRPSGTVMGLNEIGKRELEIRIAAIRTW